MTSTGTNGGIHQRIADLARTLHVSQTAEPEVVVIERITEYAANTVPGAKYAGVTLVYEKHRVETTGATHPIPPFSMPSRRASRKAPA